MTPTPHFVSALTPAPAKEPAPPKEEAAPPVEPVASDVEPVPIPANMRPGRGRRTQPKKRSASSATARAFSLPTSLLARLERFGLGQTERTGVRFNYSAYVALVLDADLTKRGF